MTVTSGTELQLHVSTEHARFGVRLFRCGATVEEVESEPSLHAGHLMPLGRPDEAWGWPPVTVQLSPALRDGVYVAVPLPERNGAVDPIEPGTDILTRTDACLFVLRRAAGDDRPTVLFKLPTATYTAYNQLGGASLYAGVHWTRDWWGQGYVGSLQRPGNGGIGGRVMEGDAPDAYHRGSRRQTFAHWDAPFVAWLEEHGYRAAYCTDFDLHGDPSLLDGVTLLLSAGHDEYWSTEMRRRVLEFVDRGGNVCFFAGDVACFVVEISPRGDRLFCRKMEGGSPGGPTRQIGALWHADDPEDWLTLSSGAYGGGWWDGVRALDGYHAVVASHWAFEGVEFPPEGLTGGSATPVIGYETDGVPLERASDPPRLSEQRKGGGGGRVLLALGRLSAGWVAGREEANAAIMIRTAASGAMVFSTGTTDWPLALTDDRISRITDNVVRRLCARPLRIHGPICPEGEYVGEGAAVGAETEVRWYVDGDQAARAGLTGLRWSVQGEDHAGDEGTAIVTRSPDGQDWLTVTATARDSEGKDYFGSQTVRVLSTEEYLRRRIIRVLDAMAFPDEQGGALVDQHASEGELAQRVIPVRLGWVQRHAKTLETLMAALEEIWTASGRMDEGALRAGER
ncbi:MAG: N,N-dimethylformamidase beta subunit family domain-containing protein [Acidimicrobiales bacterium]